MLEAGELSKEHLEQSLAYIISSVVANFFKNIVVTVVSSRFSEH